MTSLSPGSQSNPGSHIVKLASSRIFVRCAAKTCMKMKIRVAGIKYKPHNYRLVGCKMNYATAKSVAKGKRKPGEH